MQDNKLTGMNIARLREMRGLTQKQLAEKSGIADTYLSNMECGRRGLSPAKRDKLAEALECDPEEFYADIEKKKPLDSEASIIIKRMLETLPKERARRDKFMSQLWAVFSDFGDTGNSAQ